MTPVSVFLSVLFFTLLGMAYVKGYDVVKRRSPENLVQFYLIMATLFSPQTVKKPSNLQLCLLYYTQ